MSKYKEYSKTFGNFYDNFRRWCREMAARGELSDHPEEQFHLSSLDIENKKSIVYTDKEINQTAHFCNQFNCLHQRLESDFYKKKKGQIETVVNTQAKTLE